MTFSKVEELVRRVALFCVFADRGSVGLRADGQDLGAASVVPGPRGWGP